MKRERKSHGAVGLRSDTDFYACARLRLNVYVSARACKQLLESTCSSIVNVPVSLERAHISMFLFCTATLLLISDVLTNVILILSFL